MSKKQLNTKSIARIAAIQTLYKFQFSGTNSDIESILLEIEDFYKDKDTKNDYEIEKNNDIKLRPSYEYLRELVQNTHNNLGEIDTIITKYITKQWSLDSLPKLLLALLRISICEIKYFLKTPRKVIINEYTDIAGVMLGSGEIGFVNSLLDNYSRSNKS